MFKRILSVIFISVILFNIAGYLVVFKKLQHDIKCEIKAKIKRQLDNKNLVLIKYPAKPDKQQHKIFRWKEDNEFVYKGNMYDVVRQYCVNDTIYYYCINDTKEKALFSNLSGMIDQNMATSNLANNLFRFFRLTIDQSYLFEFSDYCLLLQSKAIFRLYLTPGYVPVQIEIDTPPPETV